MQLHNILGLALGFFVGIGSICAQPLPVGGVYSDYARVLQVANASNSKLSFANHPIEHSCSESTSTHPWIDSVECYRPDFARHIEVGVVSPTTDLFLNSRRPYGQNDGFVWQGAGATARLAGGAFIRYRFLSARLLPQIIYTQNADFELSRLPVTRNQPVYAYPYRSDIDLPQRFGDESWAKTVLDGSYVKVAFHSLAAGLSKENLWWGPSLRNSIVMSNNAGAFTHVFLGSEDPIKTPIGTIEGRWLWGSLSHSNYFVDASYHPTNTNRGSEKNDRFVTGLTLNWSPIWIPGLYVGASQSLMLHYSVQRRFFRDYLGVVNLPFFDSDESRGNGTDDKIVSLFARWVHSADGIEVYGEWARGDHTSSFRDFFIEPDHARGWTLGLQKVFKPSRQVWTRLIAEYTNLEKPRQSGFRRNRGSYFYVHEGIKQGYTHEGQIIGAGIGPGSNSQYIQFDVFAPFGKAGIHLLRWVHDNDRFYRNFLGEEGRTWWLHEVELGGGASFMTFWSGFEIGGSITYTEIWNHDYVDENDIPNVNFRLSVRKQLMGLR